MHDFIEKNNKYVISLIVLFLIAINITIWNEVFKKESEPDMRISIFNIGQGDSIFVNSRDGTQILVDGGPNSKVLSLLKDHMQYYDRSIDLVIATHPHKDHITGLIDVLKRYNVDTFIESGATYNTSEYFELERLIKEKGIRHIILESPGQLSFYNDAQLKLLTPDHSFNGVSLKNVHDADIVSELDFEGRKVLLMGDAEKSIEKKLIAQKAVGSSDVLKVGHHGSKTSSVEEFLSIVRPKYAVISVGKNNYGHPNQGVLDRLVSIGSHVLRTDLAGTIDVDIQQGVLHVSTKKQ